ncbi:hypothetical protein Tco_0635511 [Tanacetum coccineum]
MTTLAEHIIVAGGENRPPMLEKSMMTMQQVLVNTKFLNALPPEWSKFVTNVKLAKTDPRIAEVQVTQQIIPHNSAFQTEDLDAYDSDCDDLSSAKAVLMANLLSCDLVILSEVPYSDTYLNDMINQAGQEMPYSEQTQIMDFPDNEITSDSNIIPYS